MNAFARLVIVGAFACVAFSQGAPATSTAEQLGEAFLDALTVDGTNRTAMCTLCLPTHLIAAALFDKFNQVWQHSNECRAKSFPMNIHR